MPPAPPVDPALPPGTNLTGGIEGTAIPNIFWLLATIPQYLDFLFTFAPNTPIQGRIWEIFPGGAQGEGC